MDTIRLTIDGQALEAAPGATILEVAEENDLSALADITALQIQDLNVCGVFTWQDLMRANATYLARSLMVSAEVIETWRDQAQDNLE